MSKYAKDGSDHYLALLQLRSTPLDNMTPSPGELLQNRQLTTTLPVNIRSPANSEGVRAALKSRQVYTSHDANTKELSKILPTQLVGVESTLTKKWKQGVIKSNAEITRSYIVQTPQGEKRRNRIHLREVAIPTKIVLRAPNGEKVKSVSTAIKQSPVVQSVPIPVVQSVPKPIVQ